MIDDDEEFLRDLMQTFREDAEERIRLLSQAIVDLESSGQGADVSAPLESLYRETHSLKGASGAVEQVQMESVCQHMESVLSALKDGEIEVTHTLIDTLSETVDCLTDLLLGRPEADECATALVETLTTLSASAPQKSKASSAKKGKQASKKPGKPAEKVETAGAAREPAQTARATDSTANTDNVRVSTGKLEAIMLQAEELITVKLASVRRSTALGEVSSRLETWRRELYQARVSGDQGKIQEFLDWNAALVDGLLAELRMLSKSADDERRNVGPLVDELLDSMKRVLMLPVSSLLSSFPKMVRDLARSGGKEVDLVVTGADIEIDKRIIENLKDPLVHILRNSVDHGIETPDVRRERGKPDRGRIAIAVRQLENNKIELCVSDDGGGIDMDRLREVAKGQGIRTQKQLEETSDADLLRLAFTSGVSTSAEVSTISGRGLGLAIVDDKVRQLGGSVAVESTPGAGTLFRVNVPATLATARGVLVEVADRLFVIPVIGVDRATRVQSDDIRMVENRETIQLEGHTLPLYRLSDILEVPHKPQRSASELQQAVVVGVGEDRVAFLVDRVVGEQEVLVKALGPQLLRVRNVSGATVLSSGKVVPILNVVDLVNSAATRPARSRPQTGDTEGAARKAVLIAEDSITSRMLLKNVLEAAGYYVRPTVDGQDALKALGEEEFDLVVSDIEMPHMDGIELTRRIRNDKRLARMPVVLVTALESQEDRERGLDAGANAYLTKSSFTQGTLLKTARSLL